MTESQEDLQKQIDELKTKFADMVMVIEANHTMKGLTYKQLVQILKKEAGDA